MATKQRTLCIFKAHIFKEKKAQSLLWGLIKRATHWSERELPIQIDRIRVWHNPPRSLVEQHYQHMRNHENYEKIINSMCDGTVMVITLSGESIIQRVRDAIGSVDQKNTLRGAFSTDYTNNAIHASSSIEEAEREIELWTSYEKSSKCMCHALEGQTQ